MSTNQDFINAILSDKSNDDLRLVYADWLMEQDTRGSNERGEFIRLQIEHDQLRLQDVPPIPQCTCKSDFAPHKKDCPHHQWVLKYTPRVYKGDRLRRRKEELFNYGEARGTVGLPLGTSSGYWTTDPVTTTQTIRLNEGSNSRLLYRFVWCKGFIEKVETDADLWEKGAYSVLSHHPIKEVTFLSYPTDQREGIFLALCRITANKLPLQLRTTFTPIKFEYHSALLAQDVPIWDNLEGVEE
jgi:uncharacterized protein (TIGR02996 family)